MARVFFLLPYKELLAPAEALAKDYSGFSELKIVVAETDQAAEIAKEADKDGYEIIIARGVQAQIVKQAVSLPVVEFKASTQAVGVLSDQVREFFAGRGIELRILSPQPQDLNWYGRMRRPGRNAGPDEAEDLFISLAAPDSFASAFAAVSSPARFKVGRVQLPGGTYDLVIKDRRDVCESAIIVFKTMTQLLNQIQ